MIIPLYLYINIYTKYIYKYIYVSFKVKSHVIKTNIQITNIHSRGGIETV